VLFRPVSRDAVDMQRFDVAGAVLPDPAFGFRLGPDIHTVGRLEDDLLKTFKGEIGLDPGRL